MSEYDAIVIGSGHNGLTCAAYLAKSGMKVLVLEQASSLGGMTNTEELTLPGFKSDSHAFGYQLANVSPVPRELALHRHGFELIEPEIGLSHAFPDGTALSVFRDLERSCEGIARYSARDAAAYRTLCERFAAQAETFASKLNVPPGSPAEERAALERTDDWPDAFRFQLQSFRSWARETFEAERTRLLLGAWCCHVGLSPDDASGADAACLFSTVIQRFGNNAVKGGMRNLPLALARFLEAHGGAVRTNARVRKILVENGRAVGVRLEGGETIDVGSLVASNVDPPQLALELLGEEVVGATIARKMHRYELGESVLVVYLALDGPVHYRAGEAPGRAAYVHPVASLDAISRQFQECRSGLLPSQPFALLCNESAVDPSRVPEGRALLKLVVQPVPWCIRGEASDTIRGTTWQEVKEPYADRVIDQLTRDTVPDLRDRIACRVVHSPEDLEARLPSARHGTIMHGAALPYQSGGMRPIPELGHYRSPVANVYLCGSGSHPGPGVTMAPGRNAAQVIHRDLSLAFPGG